MSKKISFRGMLADGLEDKLNIATLNGKTGYRITKFSIMSNSPGYDNYETTVKIYSKKQGAATGANVDFTESNLLAVAYMEDDNGPQNPMSNVVIFDNEVFNQNIFVSAASRTGTVPANYYIELETIALSESQATQLTLKNLRNIASREP